MSAILRTRTIHSGNTNQEESEVIFTTFSSEPEERYLFYSSKIYCLRFSGSEIVLINDYGINSFIGNYDIP